MFTRPVPMSQYHYWSPADVYHDQTVHVLPPLSHIIYPAHHVLTDLCMNIGEHGVVCFVGSIINHSTSKDPFMQQYSKLDIYLLTSFPRWRVSWRQFSCSFLHFLMEIKILVCLNTVKHFNFAGTKFVRFPGKDI